jgi:hypothetical protein
MSDVDASHLTDSRLILLKLFCVLLYLLVHSTQTLLAKVVVVLNRLLLHHLNLFKVFLKKLQGDQADVTL